MNNFDVVLNERNLSIDILLEGNRRVYSVDLERCQTSAEVLDWLAHLHAKSWVTPRVMHDVLTALNDAFRKFQGGPIQGVLCPWGSNKTVEWPRRAA